MIYIILYIYVHTYIEREKVIALNVMLNGGAPSDKPLIGDGNQRDPVLKRKWQIRACLSLGLPHENMAGYMFFPVNH